MFYQQLLKAAFWAIQCKYKFSIRLKTIYLLASISAGVQENSPGVNFITVWYFRKQTYLVMKDSYCAVLIPGYPLPVPFS